MAVRRDVAIRGPTRTMRRVVVRTTDITGGARTKGIRALGATEEAEPRTTTSRIAIIRPRTNATTTDATTTAGMEGEAVTTKTEMPTGVTHLTLS